MLVEYRELSETWTWGCYFSLLKSFTSISRAPQLTWPVKNQKEAVILCCTNELFGTLTCLGIRKINHLETRDGGPGRKIKTRILKNTFTVIFN